MKVYNRDSGEWEDFNYSQLIIDINMLSTKELTKGQIREAALKHFQSMGFDCWRNNNTSPTRRRTFIGKYGVSDIIGFKKGVLYTHPGWISGEGNSLEEEVLAGQMLAVEVKTKGDKLSDAQKDFLVSLNKAGGYGYVAEDDGNGGINYYLYLVKK